MSLLQNGGAAPAPTADAVIDTTTQTFMKDVIEESRRQPVLVDFWAPWCGPCKQLTPILEKAVRAAKGKVKLAKMDIDKHPEIPGQMGIQSIPAVIAFVNGQPADGFMGALPEGQVTAFLERLLKDRIGGEEKDLLKAADDGAGREGFRRRGRSLCAGAGARQRQCRGARRSRALLCRHRLDRSGQENAGAGSRSKAPRRGGRRGAGRDRSRRAGEIGRPGVRSRRPRSRPIPPTIRRASISPSRSTPRASARRPPII